MATDPGRITGRIPIAIPLLVSAVALLAVACGGDSSTASKTSAPSAKPNARAEAKTPVVDPCVLVDEKAASTAVGAPVSRSSPTAGVAGQGGGVCYYSSQEPPAEVVIYAIVFPDSESARAGSPDQLAQAFNPAMGLTKAKVVAGIGDRATEYDTTGTGAVRSVAIFVVKSQVVLMIWMAPAKDGSAIESLAKSAVSKL
jgi:hypothetical protein